jgi:2-polyprenyl-3-methyl-5-hydroxy-6-metoxy-1,4-benzoquinol methylase
LNQYYLFFATAIVQPFDQEEKMSETEQGYIEWKDWKEEEFGRFSRFDATYFEAEVFSRISSNHCRALEIGFGNGAFLGFAKSKRIDVVGIESNELLVQRARELGIAAYKSISELKTEELFDVIVAFDVIEHIEQEVISSFLAQLGTHLKENGKLVARFPNGDSPFGRINQHGDATHLTTLGRHKFRRLATMAGFEVEYLGNPAVAIKGVGLRAGLRRAFRKALTHPIEVVVSSLYFAGESVSLDPNYTAVLRKTTR